MTRQKKVIAQWAEIDPSKVGNKIPLSYSREPNPMPAEHIPPHSPQYSPETSEPSAPAYNEDAAPSPKTSSSASSSSSESISLSTLFIILAALVAVIFGVYSAMTKTSKAHVTVEYVKYTSTVALEQNRLYNEEGWTIPAGATVYHTETRLYDTQPAVTTVTKVCRDEEKQVPSHQEYSHTEKVMMDDGSIDSKDVYTTVYKTEVERICEDQVVTTPGIPDYRQYYKYQIWRWTPLTPISISGTNAEPQWPQEIDFPSRDSSYRLARKSQTFVASMREKESNKQYEYDIPTIEAYRYAWRHIQAPKCVATWSYTTLHDLTC